MKHEAIYQRVITWMTTRERHDKIDHFSAACTGRDYHWMWLPEVGRIVATLYNVVFVSYSGAASCTCLPVIVEDGAGAPVSTIVLGHVNKNHFILLHMNEDNNYPIPIPALYWEQGRDQSAANLGDPYRARMNNYNGHANARRDAFLETIVTELSD